MIPVDIATPAGHSIVKKYALDQILNQRLMILVVRKPVFGVSDQVRHKPGCTATGDG